MIGEGPFWRVFPWDERAPDGAPHSAGFVPRPTGRGRFDLAPGASPVLYLAESPEHAVAELIHPWRGRTVGPRHLTRAGLPLALVEVEVLKAGDRVLDLCDPRRLDEIGARPDDVASRSRSVTQPIARAAWGAGHAGVRWWSRFWGDWHTTVLFAARWDIPGAGGSATRAASARPGDSDRGEASVGSIPDDSRSSGGSQANDDPRSSGDSRSPGRPRPSLRFGLPTSLTTGSAPLLEAAGLLGIGVTA